MSIRKHKGAAFVFYRFIETIIAQYKSFKSPGNEELKRQAKELEQRVAILNLFERFIESAPQMLLQVYILTMTSTSLDVGSFKGELF